MAVRNDFTAGEVLAAADLNDTFASKVDYALPVNAQTGTTYTFVLADAEKLTTASNASPVTLTIPPASSVAWPDNTVLRVVNYGAGAVTIDGGSGVTVTNTATTVAQYGAAVAIRTGSDAWTVVPFGGGDVPAAAVSSPAATGQYTSGGFTYDYYTFTSSGSLVVDKAGLADVLIVGGGGAGGYFYGGGGGAGGYLYAASTYLSATTHTVTVGAGGAISTSPGDAVGRPGNLSRLSDLQAVGGGGGGAWYSADANSHYGGTPGGSGGGQAGAAAGNTVKRTFGTGFPPQGNNGGSVSSTTGGGGGSAGAASGTSAGSGTSNSITGSAVTYAAGGSSGSGAGSANTGNGGGGGTGAAGGSGVVIIRVKV